MMRFVRVVDIDGDEFLLPVSQIVMFESSGVIEENTTTILSATKPKVKKYWVRVIRNEMIREVTKEQYEKVKDELVQRIGVYNSQQEEKKE